MESLRDAVKAICWHLHWKNAAAGIVGVQLAFEFNEGPEGVRWASKPWEKLTSDEQERILSLFRWGISQVPNPTPYKLLGKEIRPTLEIDVLSFGVYGSSEHLHPTFGISTWETHPHQRTNGPLKILRQEELPSAIHELARSLDQLAWSIVAEEIARVLKIDLRDARAMMPLLVYIAYRSGEGEDIARKFASFLREENEFPWFALQRMGVGDSLTGEMDRGIADASAAVFVFTKGFMDGPTARHEYEAITAKARLDSRFRRGVIRVGTEMADLPPMLQDLVNVSIRNRNESELRDAFLKLYRGLMRLPQE